MVPESEYAGAGLVVVAGGAGNNDKSSPGRIGVGYNRLPLSGTIGPSGPTSEDTDKQRSQA